MKVEDVFVWHGQAAALSGLPVAINECVFVQRHGQTVQSDGLPVPHETAVIESLWDHLGR